MLNSQNKEIIYISKLLDIEIEEIAYINKIEGDKIYCIDTFKNFLIFNSKTGYCYNDNNTFGAKKYLKLNT
jgi:hypothetical protein